MAGARSGALVTNYPFLSIPYLSSKLLDSQQRSSYDRIPPFFQAYLETLTATCAQHVFRTASVAGNYAVMSPRGSPLNTGGSLARPHPIIRTNRITGWKFVFAGMELHVSRINDVYASRTRLGSVSRHWRRETTTTRLEYTKQRTVWQFGITAAFSML